jgi:hypothetical protein
MFRNYLLIVFGSRASKIALGSGPHTAALDAIRGEARNSNAIWEQFFGKVDKVESLQKIRRSPFSF